jgi:hypothetical protein
VKENRRILTGIALLTALSCPLLADVGYEPRAGSLSLAGTGHGKPAVPIKILPRNVVWTQARLTEAFGPNWTSGVPGAHQPDYAQYLESQFADRSARWLNGADDPRYRDNVPLARKNLGVASEWEVLYAYYTRDARVIPRQTKPPVDPVSTCPLGQTCQPFPPPTCPSCSSCCTPTVCPPAPSAPVYATISSPPTPTPVDVWILPSQARFQAAYFSTSKLYLLRSGVGMLACPKEASTSSVLIPCVYAWQTIPSTPNPEASK